MDLQKQLDSAVASAERGDYATAAQEYETVLKAMLINCAGLSSEELAKTVRSIAFNLAQVLNKLSRYQEALKNVEFGLAQAPTAYGIAIALAAKGEALYGLQRSVDGKKMFEEAARAHPIVGRLNSADSMVRLDLPELLALADEYVNTVVTVFGGQLNDSLRAEVESIRGRIAAKRKLPQSSSECEAARNMACEAIKRAKIPGQLGEASRLMEEALIKDPALCAEYEYQLQLWRKGVAM